MEKAGQTPHFKHYLTYTATRFDHSGHSHVCVCVCVCYKIRTLYSTLQKVGEERTNG